MCHGNVVVTALVKARLVFTSKTENRADILLLQIKRMRSIVEFNIAVKKNKDMTHKKMGGTDDHYIK